MTDKTHIDSSMPFAEYVRIDGINATSLKAGINESPLAMHYRMTGDEEDRDTEEKHKGSLAHIAILEPEAFASKVSVFPGPITAKTRATNAWKEFAADHELPILPDELPALMELPGAVHANRFAHDLLSRTEHEVSLFWHDSLYGQAKARLDGLDGKVGIVELKTTTAWPRRKVLTEEEMKRGDDPVPVSVDATGKRSELPRTAWVVLARRKPVLRQPAARARRMGETAQAV